MWVQEMEETLRSATATLVSSPGPSEGSTVVTLLVSLSSMCREVGRYSSSVVLPTDLGPLEFGTCELHALCLTLGLPLAPRLSLVSCSTLYTSWNATWRWQSP